MKEINIENIENKEKIGEIIGRRIAIHEKNNIIDMKEQNKKEKGIKDNEEKQVNNVVNNNIILNHRIVIIQVNFDIVINLFNINIEMNIINKN